MGHYYKQRRRAELVTRQRAMADAIGGIHRNTVDSAV